MEDVYHLGQQGLCRDELPLAPADSVGYYSHHNAPGLQQGGTPVKVELDFLEPQIRLRREERATYAHKWSF